MTREERFMKEAILLSEKALESNHGGPFGCVIVKDNKIIARGYNQVEKLNDPTAHAEIIALTSAFNFLGSKYLPEGTVYVTVEPCVMCAGAMYWAKIGRLVYGASDEKNGYLRVTRENPPFHPKTELIRGVLKDDCAALMKSFFQSKR